MAVIMFESAAFKQTWLFSDALSELNASCNFAEREALLLPLLQ